MLNFKLDFEQRLAQGLAAGGYEGPAEFARAVTNFYMTTVVKGTPAGIPPTLPVGYTPFNPAPIGPASPIPYRSREKLFYNTIKAYYTVKELDNAKSFIEFTTRDIQNAVKTITKLQQEIQEKAKRLAEIDDEVKQLKEDIKSIGPEVREFFKDKKDTFIEFLNSVDVMINKLGNLPIGDTAEGGIKATFADEIGVFNTVKNFKIDLTKIKDAIKAIANLAKMAVTKLKSYQNSFSTADNIKVFLWKRVDAFVKETMKVIGAVINPAEAIGYLKELLRIPKAEKFARILLRIVNRNQQLKYQKDTLIRSIESIKQEIKDRISNKVERLKEAVIEKAKIISGTRRKGGQKKAKRESIKRFKEELKIVAKGVKFALKLFKYFTDLLNTVVSIMTKIDTIIGEFKDYWNITIKQELIQKAKDSIKAIREQVTNNTAEDININLVFKQFTITNAAIKTILEKVAQSAKLTSPELIHKIKQPVDRLEKLLEAVEFILEKDIPALIHSVNNPPRRDGSFERMTARRRAKVPSTVKKHKISPAKIVDKIKYGLKKVADVVKKIRQEYIKKLKDKAVKKLKELQKDVTDYIAEITNFDPTAQKIKAKKLEVDQKRVETEDERIKAEQIAKSAVLFAKMTQAGLKIANRIAPTDGSAKQLSISANEKDLLDFLKYYGQWEILVNRKTKQQVADDYKLVKRKIKDFKVYEQLFEFFKEMVVEFKEKRENGETFQSFIADKLDKLKERAVEYATSDFEDRINQLKGFFTTPPKTLSDFVNLPLGLVDIIDFNTDLFLGESRFLKKTRSKIQNLEDQIPEDTQDSVLLFFKDQLQKGVGIVNSMMKLFKRGMDKLVKFVKQRIIDPATAAVKKFIEEKKVKFEERVRDKAKRKLDAETQRKIDAAAATFVFGLAARLFWTGLTWKNPVDTTFTVLNIAPFKPINPDEYNTAAGMAKEMSMGFEGQVKAMTGLCIPNPSLAIPPFPFQGYI